MSLEHLPGRNRHEKRKFRALATKLLRQGTNATHVRELLERERIELGQEFPVNAVEQLERAKS